MRFKKRVGAPRVYRKRKPFVVGFNNQKFLELMADLTGVSPVGEFGRETPLDCSSLEAARGSLLIRELFSKFDDGKPSPTKEIETWKKFYEAEASCQTINDQISAWDWTEKPFWVSVRSRIADVLGRFDWDECAKFFAFGPGGTTRLTRRESAAAYKYSGIPESTIGNATLATCAIAMLPIWKQIVLDRGGSPDRLVQTVVGNSVITVPKNYKTDRTIAKEPCMNMYIQKGIGQCIRRRLCRVGVNLNDQSLNQDAARKGSITGGLATLDLSMASDTVSKGLVNWLLPIEWLEALEQCRSQFGVLPSGEVIHYQKFSSMGNGYTFELESLIFWAIAQECAKPFNRLETDPSICVYGDDIVIPTHLYETLVSRLLEVGFKPNLKKSFHSGPYRESCGKHYFLGIDITPFYVRKPVKILFRLFLCHNNVFRWAERTGVEAARVLNILKNLAPASWREPRLPDGFGDGAFIGDVSDLRLDSHPYGWDFWIAKALVRTQSELRDLDLEGQLVASLKLLALEGSARDPSLRRIRLRESSSGIPVRVGGFREVRLLIPRYPHSPKSYRGSEAMLGRSMDEGVYDIQQVVDPSSQCISFAWH